MNPFVEDFKRAWHKPNSILIRLIIINAVVFLVFLFAKIIGTIVSNKMVYDTLQFVMYLPAPLTKFMVRPWTVFTYFFTHEDLMHIVFNMFALYWFGRIAEEYLGHLKTLVLYVYGGLAGGILYLLAYNFIPFFINIQPAIGVIGASASVYAIIAGTATLLPNYGLHLLFFGRVQLKYIAIFVILLSVIGSIGSNAGGNLAHLGGALLGFLFIKSYQRNINIGLPLEKLFSFTENLFRKSGRKANNRQKKKQKAHKATANQTFSNDLADDIPNQDEIDTILDKISQKGYESLTRKEKEILFKASQK